MRRIGFVFLATLGPSCGTPESPSAAELDGLLQRLDAMERRIDELEDAAEARAAAAPARPPGLEPGGPSSFPPRLPPGPPPRQAVAPSLHVNVRASGISVDGKILTQEDAVKRFREAGRQQPPPRLVMLAEPDVPHARMVEVMDLAKEAGLTHISMSAKFSGGGTAPPPR